MKDITVYRLVSLGCLSLYLMGLLNTYISDRNDQCDMTYMFEYPQFVQITLPNNKYPQYGLYAYAEGRLTEKVRKMKFDGIPVLFLPGNSGSHMQSRSLASVALRKALSDVYDYHFDFFTVSFNEDLSGLFGGVLYHETLFTIECIEIILGLYLHNIYTKTVPTQVILIGHSMGGVIAKRLLAYPETINMTNIAIALASPLQAPVVNTDENMNHFYKTMDREWESMNENAKNSKMLLSFGNGVRDTLMTAALTSSGDCDVSALTTAVPGVWVSPDHVSIVWCKQLVLAINKFLFSIVDPRTKQVVGDKKFLMTKARQFFQANRSMTLSPNISRANVTMVPDAFWYEDNRRTYQISRPEISKMTYLMIRLVTFPHNRFVAIESVNVDDRDWIFGCNAQYTYGSHRYCKQATSLTELSRWSGAVAGAGRRKLATIDLHELAKLEPTWTHVVVKVSPTRKPIVLNVDINNLSSRQLIVKLPFPFDLITGRIVIKQQTDPESLYYELILPGFSSIHQAFLLHVEPTATCQAKEYHVTAEMHVPWAPNHEYFHYFTHAERSPMVLRLSKSNADVYMSDNATQHVKVTLLLDPQCSFTIRISYSWFHRFASMARHYTPVLIPYTAAAILLAARASIEELSHRGKYLSLHSALASEHMQPYCALLASPVAWILTSIPVISYYPEWFSSKNEEIINLMWSPLLLAMYMTAVGLLNVVVAAVLVALVCSSQLSHRLFYRLLWREPPAFAERAAEGLRRIPLAVGIIITMCVPFSCGAASMAIGGIYYAFLISNMYEAYLEDYLYKLLAKAAARVCNAFKFRRPTQTPATNESEDVPAIEDQSLAEQSNSGVPEDQSLAEPNNSGVPEAIAGPTDSGDRETTLVRRKIAKSNKGKPLKSDGTTKAGTTKKNAAMSKKKGKTPAKIKDDKQNETEQPVKAEAEEVEAPPDIHFHMTMFMLWMGVTVVNIPTLITWARNYQYNKVLQPDPSYYTGFMLSGCSVTLWQLEAPIVRLKHYKWISALLLYLAIFLLALGPRALMLVNYGLAFAYLVLIEQQILDAVMPSDDDDDEDDDSGQYPDSDGDASSEENPATNQHPGSEQNTGTKGNAGRGKSNSNRKASVSNEQKRSGATGKAQQCPSDDVTGDGNDCCESSENRIHNEFKNLKEKIAATEEL